MKSRLLTVFAVFFLILFAASSWSADLWSNVLPKFVIGPDTSVSNNDNTTGTVIDRLGYGSVTYVIQTGTLADNDVTLTPYIYECGAADCSDGVTATAFIGTIAGATFAATDDNTIKSIAYNGVKRYTQLIITPAANTGAARFNAFCILGHKQYGPAQ